jgi:hypothetical protein
MGLTALPSHFDTPGKAWEFYSAFAPCLDSDEDIGREWQKFKGLFAAMGGGRNLKPAMDAYTFACDREKQGHSWDDILSHIYSNLTLGSDYCDAPLRDPGEPSTPDMALEESDDFISIEGIRLKRREE